MEDRLRQVTAKGQESGDVVGLLKEAAELCGGLGGDTIRQIASWLGVPAARLYGVATFYSFLSVEPLGKNVIRVCRSVPCFLKNGERVVEAVHNCLGIRPGETTRDGKFTLELVNCIGACDVAPAMMVNDGVYGDLTPEKVGRILRTL